MQIKIPKLKNFLLFFCTLCLGAYVVLKIYRNSLNADTGTQGGIWNVINLLFVGIAFIQGILGANALRNKPKCISWGFLYAWIAFILSLFTIDSLSLAVVFRLFMLFYFSSVMLVFYANSRKGIDPYARGGMTLAFYVVGVFCLYLMLQRVTGRKEIYQSDMYFMLCLLPFMMLWKKGVGFYLPLLLTVAVIILSGKRTATLAIVGAVLVFYFLQMKQDGNLKSFFKTFWKLAVVTALILLAYSYLSKNYEINLLERLENLEEDGGSGRDDIYLSLLTAIKNSNPIRWIVGYGNNAVIRVYGRTSAAHNDFIEIMFDYGIFAVIALVGFYVSIIRECAKMVKYKYPGAPAFAASIVVAIMMSMFSNFIITFTHISGMAAFWGVALAEWNEHRRQLGSVGQSVKTDIPQIQRTE